MTDQLSTDGTGRERPAQPPHTPGAPTQSDRRGATYHRLKAAGVVAVWGGIYVALTGALLYAGALGTIYAATVVLPGPAGLAAVFPLGIGSIAVSPTVARLILIRVYRRCVDSAEESDDTAATTGPHTIAQRSEEGVRC